jgi:chromosome partitioning protein
VSTVVKSWHFMLRIAIAARKGGVGKTSLSTGLASIFAARRIRTLVVDLDPQSNAAYALGLSPTLPGTAELLLNEPVDYQSVSDTLHVLAGGARLLDPGVLTTSSTDLRDRIKDLTYDAVCFDCPPGSPHLERLALHAANVVIACTDAHPLAVLGASRVISELESKKGQQDPWPSRWAFALTKIDSRRALDAGLAAEIQEKYPTIPSFSVRQDTNVAWSSVEGKGLLEYAPSSKATQDMKVIADWLLT